MLVKLKNILGIAIGSTIGVFIGKSIWTYYYYQKHHEFSTPWYYQVLISGIMFTIVLIFELIVYLFISHRIKKCK